jgi:hypothetical protein
MKSIQHTPSRQFPLHRRRPFFLNNRRPLPQEIRRDPVPTWALEFNRAIDAAYMRRDDAEVNRLLREKYQRVQDSERALVA